MPPSQVPLPRSSYLVDISRSPNGQLEINIPGEIRSLCTWFPLSPLTADTIALSLPGHVTSWEEWISIPWCVLLDFFSWEVSKQSPHWTNAYGRSYCRSSMLIRLNYFFLLTISPLVQTAKALGLCNEWAFFTLRLQDGIDQDAVISKGRVYGGVDQ
jgi:hypothetical protein